MNVRYNSAVGYKVEIKSHRIITQLFLFTENWLALDSSIVGDTFSDSNPKYFLNVCHDLVDSTATTSCPEGTAICKMYKGELTQHLPRHAAMTL